MSIGPYIFLALVILAIVAVFIGWGVSLIWRAMTYARGRDGRRSCPSCNEDMRGLSSLTCPSCQNTAMSEIDLQACKPIRPALVGGIVSIVFSLVFLFVSWYIFVNELGFQDSIIGFQAMIATGVALIAAALIARGTYGERSKGRRRCPSCWYPIRTENLTCPECGHTAKSAQDFFRTRRNRKVVLLGVLALALSASPFVVNTLRKSGTVGFIPTFALIWLMPIVPDHWIDGGFRSYSDDQSLSARLRFQDSDSPMLTMYRDAASLRAVKLSVDQPLNARTYRELLFPPHTTRTRSEFVEILVSALESGESRRKSAAVNIVLELDLDTWEYFGQSDSSINQGNCLAGLENRLLALIQPIGDPVSSAALKLTHTSQVQIPSVARFYMDRQEAGHQLAYAEWAAILSHGKGHLPIRDALRHVTSSNLTESQHFLMHLENEDLLDPAWLQRVEILLDSGDSNVLQLLSRIYARRQLATERFAPNLAGAIDYSDPESMSSMLWLMRFGKEAPEALHFNDIAMLHADFKFESTACYALSLYIESFPEWHDYARSAALAHISKYTPRPSQSALDLLRVTQNTSHNAKHDPQRAKPLQ